MHYTYLADRSLIQLSGDDASVFLQGLVSNDVSRLQKGEAIYAALLTPQGKFLHDFFLLPWKQSILIDCDKDAVPDLLHRLTMYKLRSKVTIQPMAESFGTVAMWGNQKPETRSQKSEMEIFPDPRLAQLGWRIIGETAVIESWCADQKMSQDSMENYDRMRLELGVPGSQDMIYEKSLLLEFGFEDLRGVDFKKGCYVGQEVTARSKYRGQVRKFIYQVQTIAGALPACGTAVMLGDVPAGELRSSQGGIGLALLKVEEVGKAQAENKKKSAGEVALKVMLPAWVAHPPKAIILEE